MAILLVVESRAFGSERQYVLVWLRIEEGFVSFAVVLVLLLVALRKCGRFSRHVVSLVVAQICVALFDIRHLGVVRRNLSRLAL